MARDNELTGLGLAPAPAAMLGYGPGAGGLTGAGTSSQANALALVQGVNIFTTAAANSGGRLPAAGMSGPIAVINSGANALLVYPATGETINALSANSSFSVTNAKMAVFWPVANTWVAILSAGA
jgi:hypothetical protein